MFIPLVPTEGLVGWRILKDSVESQVSRLADSPQAVREVEHFKANIGNVTSAQDLVSDRTLLQVSLGAFGLQEDINNRFFIEKVLSEGVSDPDSLANRLADQSYREFSRAMGLAPTSTGLLSNPSFQQEIVSSYLNRRFETLVGEQSETMRIALSADRDLQVISESSLSDDGRWYSALGNKPVREFLRVALGISTSVAFLDLDRQLEEFRDRLDSLTGNGSLQQFADSDALEDFTERFILRSQQSNSSSVLSASSVALSLLTA